jgi:hypothetical protein
MLAARPRLIHPRDGRVMPPASVSACDAGFAAGDGAVGVLCVAVAADLDGAGLDTAGLDVAWLDAVGLEGAWVAVLGGEVGAVMPPRAGVVSRPGWASAVPPGTAGCG